MHQSDDPRQPQAPAEPDAPGVHDDLPARLDAIGALPLDERAAAFVRLHDRLRDDLEGGDIPRATNA